MAPRGMMTVTIVLLFFILGLLSPAPAARSHSSKACCTRYNRRKIASHLIKGYREQTTTENCRLEAIIFYTVRKHEICVTRKDEWVRNALQSLSSKLQEMSKDGSAAGGNQRKESVNPTLGSFFSTTETLPNSTENFY